jgi:hypothetical protein
MFIIVELFNGMWGRRKRKREWTISKYISSVKE